ncbi:hypothetical protein SAMN04488540_105216 [Ferrimonas sediminum]|uniref:Uncharacterized protein n=1 Tax=Ferrimonas sediminum TaxID=718193 RepID=A0A1G8RLQ1_9GAMM|nr:CueP family metal-binding protein [Ferrimonas sediminum]SDJ17891.1 hypothetical protein SAMN04488540_105216 [Ferrimonas sediminum]
MFKKLVITSLMVVGLNACSQGSDIEEQAASFSQLNHKQALLQAHQWYKNEQDILVRVYPDKVAATFSDGTESHVAIPEDQFLLSIAPWVNFSHPCGNHVPTSCTGELINQKMHMSAIDIETGKKILNQMVTTQHDGFIDFWVPRNRQLKFTFHYSDANGVHHEAKELLTTFDDSRTCITTMQLVAMNTSDTQMNHHSQHH